jgi:hypothetical protein
VVLVGFALFSRANAESPPPQAVSSDGLWRLTAEPATHTLLLQDALGMQVRRYAWPGLSPVARQTSLVTPVSIQNHAARQSFVIAFGGCGELWEISYNRAAEDIFDGLVHDYRLHEGLSRPGFLGVRRTSLEQPLDDFWIDPQSPHVLGRARWAQEELQVINLDVRRVRAHMALPTNAHLAQAQPEGDGPARQLVIPVASGSSGPAWVCLSTRLWQIEPCAMDQHK